MMVKSYSHVFNFPYTIIRPSALYGERCVSRRVGQVFIENALQGQKLVINGIGDEKPDFTYIDDLVHGVVRVIKNNKSKYQTFNLTYGQGRKMKDLIKILKRNFPLIKIEYKKRDKLVPKRGGLSINKAKLIGYNPQFSIEKVTKSILTGTKNSTLTLVYKFSISAINLECVFLILNLLIFKYALLLFLTLRKNFFNKIYFTYK